MSTSAGRIDLDLGVNYNKFKKELNLMPNKVAPMMKAPLGKLAILSASAFSLKALLNFGKGALDLASDLTEVQNVVDVTFGSMAENINNFSKNALQSLGLSELSAKRFTSTMGAMLKSSGLTGQQMKDMSIDLTSLAADMASFYNLDADVAFDKIRSGVSGMTEPLKQLGINMNIANVEAYAMSKGMKKSFDKMSQAEQTLWRYKYLMEVTKDAQGDFARTSHTWANQVKLMGEQWSIFTGTMGQGFINILTPVLRGLNTLIQKIQIAAQYFKAFTELIFGAQDTSSDASSSVSDMASSLDDAGEAVKKAGKDAKNSLAGFDQLNVLTEQTASSAEDIGSGLEGGVDLGTSTSGTIDFDIDTTKLDLLKSKLEPLTKMNLDPLKQSFDGLKTAIEPFKENLFLGLSWFKDNILLPFASWTISEVIPKFLDILSGSIKVLNSVIEVFKPLATFLWESFLKPISEWTGGIIVSVLGWIGDKLSIIGDWIKEHSSFIETMAIILGSFSTAWWLVDKSLKAVCFAVEAWNVVAPIATGVTTAFGEVMAFLTSPIGIAISAIAAVIAIGILLYKNWDSISKWLKDTWTSIKDKAVEIWTGIKDVISNMWGAISTSTKNTWNGLKTNLTNIWNNIKTFASNTWGNIKTNVLNNWDSIKTGIANTKDALVKAAKEPFDIIGRNISEVVRNAYNWGKNLIQNLINGIKSMAGKVKDTVKNVAGTIGDFLGFHSPTKKGPGAEADKWMPNFIDMMVDGIHSNRNKVQDAINSLSETLSGYNSISIAQPKLSLLGNPGDCRGVSSNDDYTSGLLSLLSGSNQEALSILLKILDAIQNKDTQSIIKIGETEFGRAAIKAINKVQRQAGKTLIIV